MDDALVSDGTWTVHQRPRAIRSGDYTFVGSISSAGDVQVSAYDHTDDTATTETVGSNVDTDDHSSPAIHIRDDDRLIAFWSDTGSRDEEMYWKISDNAHDISSWGSLNTLSSATNNIEYPQPVPWDGDLRLYNLEGGTNSWSWTFRVSTDNGATFGSPETVAEFEAWSYVHPYRDGDRLHFATGDHRVSNSAIRHWYLEDGDYYESDGALIQSADNPLTSLNDLTTVHDASESGNNAAKQFDLTCDSNGNPHVAFEEHVETGSGGGDGDYRARWGKWDGSQWVTSEITEMGGSLSESEYYSGGLSLDSRDPTTVYVSVEQSNRNYQIQEWTTDDDGSTWSKVSDLSADDATITNPTKRGRPISPRGHDGSELTATWWAGRYDGYTNYDTQVMDSVPVVPDGSATKYIRQNGQWVEVGQS